MLNWDLRWDWVRRFLWWVRGRIFFAGCLTLASSPIFRNAFKRYASHGYAKLENLNQLLYPAVMECDAALDELDSALLPL